MNRSRLLLAVLVLLLVTVGWWFLLLNPKQQEIAAAEQQLQSVDDQISRLQTEIGRLRDIQDNETSYIFAIGEMEAGIPPTPDLDTFIEDVTLLAQRTGIDLDAITSVPPVAVTGPDGNDTGLFQITVVMSMEGEYFEILGFIYGLEALERIVRIDGISLTPIGISAVEEPVTTTSSTVADGESTTTTVEPRPRAEEGRLSVVLTTQIFTRTQVATPVDTTTPPGEGAAEEEGN